MAVLPNIASSPRNGKNAVRTRLHVYLARRTPVAVILRTGPAKWTEMIRWDVNKDTFERGQWLKGKINAERCDVSPGGGLFLYFTARYSASSNDAGYTSSWTAVSKPPYFTAVALWPLGNTWGGGGVFLDDHTVLLAHTVDRAHPDHPATQLHVELGYISEEQRWERNGWTMADWKLWRGLRQPLRWSKKNSTGKLRLTTQHPSWELRNRPRAYSVSKSDERELAAFEADWADWDHGGRLVAAKEGQLLRLAFDRKLNPVWSLVADFTNDVFKPMGAPQWAASF